jgi:hypothetical protein
MDYGRVVKKIFESKPKGRRRRMGRPRLRWLEDAEKDLWEMKVKRWQQKAVYREEWASVNKEATLASLTAVEPRRKYVCT